VDANSDGIGDTPYVIDANNQDNYPLMKPYAGPHDIGIVSLSASKTVIGKGYIARIRFEVINYGIDAETVIVNAFANDSMIFGFLDPAVPGRSLIGFMFDWDTTAFAAGSYTISAYAAPVPGETDTTDNTRSTMVKVTISGDVDGDFFVNIKDATQIGLYWMQTVPPAPANVDINGDGIINIKDATIIGVNWLKHA
jgi:hypothetical protein